MAKTHPTLVLIKSSNVGAVVYELVLQCLLVSDKFGHDTSQVRVLNHHHEAEADDGGPGEKGLHPIRYAPEPEFGEVRNSQCDQGQKVAASSRVRQLLRRQEVGEADTGREHANRPEMARSGIKPHKVPPDHARNADEAPDRVREQVAKHVHQTSEEIESVRGGAVFL